MKNLFNPHGKTVAFDIETKKSFDEVGGRSQIEHMELSLAVLYDYSTDSYKTFREKDANLLVDELLSATKVIGFNILYFDYKVLSPYRKDVNFKKIPTLDLLQKIKSTLGFRVSLENLSFATLGEGKSGRGIDAVKWWKEGRTDLIEKYCKKDVEITCKIYEFGKNHHYLKFTDKVSGKIKAFPVDWD